MCRLNSLKSGVIFILPHNVALVITAIEEGGKDGKSEKNGRKKKINKLKNRNKMYTGHNTSR